MVLSGLDRFIQFGRKKTKGYDMKKLALTSLLVFLAVSGAHAATMTESAGGVAKDYFVGGSIAIATDSEHASLFSVAP